MKPATEAQRRRTLKLLAVLRDPTPAAAEKRNAAATLAKLYEAHPELAALRLEPGVDSPAPAPPPPAPTVWTPEFLERVGRASLGAAERHGVVSRETSAVIGDVLDEVFSELGRGGRRTRRR